MGRRRRRKAAVRSKLKVWRAKRLTNVAVATRLIGIRHIQQFNIRIVAVVAIVCRSVHTSIHTQLSTRLLDLLVTCGIKIYGIPYIPVRNENVERK